jgi:ABC-type transport system involved in multi-copper enzyme maturation permease subunit
VKPIAAEGGHAAPEGPSERSDSGASAASNGRAAAKRPPLNPVLAKELRTRLQGRQAWILLTVYLILLGGILYIAYNDDSSTNGDPFVVDSPTRFASAGRTMFELVVLFMLLLVLFLVPGFTSGAIAGERERQSLVPLQVTLLRPWQIVVGKVGSSFALLALLVVAAAPFLGVAYLVGGVTTSTVLKGVAVVLFTGLVLAVITVGCSAVFRRVQVATVMSYAVVLFLVVGTTVISKVVQQVDENRGTDVAAAPKELLAANPLFLAADVLVDTDTLLSDDGDSPFRWLARELHRDDYADFVDAPFPGGFEGVLNEDQIAVARGFLAGQEAQFGQVVDFDELGNPVFADGGPGADEFPFWALSMIVLYLAAVGAGVVAVRRLRTPATSER